MAIAHAVGEGVAAVPVGERGVDELAASGIDDDAAMRRLRHGAHCEGVADVDVGVVGQHVDRHGGAAQRARAVARGHRCVVHIEHVQREHGAGAGAGVVGRGDADLHRTDIGIGRRAAERVGRRVEAQPRRQGAAVGERGAEAQRVACIDIGEARGGYRVAEGRVLVRLQAGQRGGDHRRIVRVVHRHGERVAGDRSRAVRRGHANIEAADVGIQRRAAEGQRARIEGQPGGQGAAVGERSAVAERVAGVAIDERIGGHGVREGGVLVGDGVGQRRRGEGCAVRSVRHREGGDGRRTGEVAQRQCGSIGAGEGRHGLPTVHRACAVLIPLQLRRGAVLQQAEHAELPVEGVRCAAPRAGVQQLVQRDHVAAAVDGEVLDPHRPTVAEEAIGVDAGSPRRRDEAAGGPGYVDGVVTVSGLDGVGAVAGVQMIVATVAEEIVVPVAAEQRVAARCTQQKIVARTAGERVDRRRIVVAGLQRVVARSAQERVVPRAADQMIRAVGADEHVVALATVRVVAVRRRVGDLTDINHVVAGAAIKRVAAAEAVERVVAAQAPHRVGARGAVEDVCTGCAGEGKERTGHEAVFGELDAAVELQPEVVLVDDEISIRIGEEHGVPSALERPELQDARALLRAGHRFAQGSGETGRGAAQQRGPVAEDVER